MPKKKIKVVYRKLGREKAHGQAHKEDGLIEIEERLVGKTRLETIIHESLHILCPEWIEEKVDAVSKDLAGVLWKEGYKL